jgi:hypothetical protein
VACNSAPVLLDTSSEGLTVRFDASHTTEEALAVAQKYCARYNRQAAFQSLAVTGDTFASYRCVD